MGTVLIIPCQPCAQTRAMAHVTTDWMEVEAGVQQRTHDIIRKSHIVMFSFCVRYWRLGEQHPRFKEHVDASACKIGARGSCDVPILAAFQFDRARVGVRSRGWRGRRLSSQLPGRCLSVSLDQGIRMRHSALRRSVIPRY
jgi:hypothetical protein